MRGIFLLVISCFIGVVYWIYKLENPPTKIENDTIFVLDSIIDLDEIKTRGKLIALSQYNANSFFIHKGQAMGYEYELLELFAKDIGVDLEIKISSSLDSLFILLKEGKGDLIAANLLITREWNEHIAFSGHHNTTRQVLIQRLPDNRRFMKQHEIRKRLIKDPLELIGKTISVSSGGRHEQRLKNLSNEIGGDINVQPLDNNYSTEDLIGMVSRGEIEYTIAEENIAALNRSYYQNLDTSVPISFSQRIAWGFRHESPQLKQAADLWMTQLKADKNPLYYVIYNKYYKNTSLYKRRRNSEYFVLETGAISPYDHLFMQYEQLPYMPWTLLASIAYQESRFNPDTESWAGAIGLMQVLPQTAADMKIDNPTTPEGSIQAGTRYLKFLYKYYWSHMEDTTEMLKFILASYNAGMGHIKDAQRLAHSLGLDSTRWDGHTAEALLKLSDPDYFYRPEVRYGYCRGKEPYQYVKEILDRWRMYTGILAANVRAKDTASHTEINSKDDTTKHLSP